MDTLDRRQVGRALRQLGIQMIRPIRHRLEDAVKEALALAGEAASGTATAQAHYVAAANQFLRDEYVKEFNRRFNVRSC